MFDFGWAEMLLIMAIAVLVIGPRELPAIMRTVGQGVRRLQYIRFALSQQFDDFMRENDLNELRREAAARPDMPDTDEEAADKELTAPPQDNAHERPDK